MKDLKQILFEKLKLNNNLAKHLNWDPETEYDNNAIHKWQEILMYRGPQSQYAEYNKMEQYRTKGSPVKKLINSIKSKEKLCKRFIIAIDMGWEEYVLYAAEVILDRKYFTENELNSYIEYYYNEVTKWKVAGPYSNRKNLMLQTLNTLRYWAQ